jgi:NAD(P)-dependent dehydrogenase (short-subunit alcohol dehydrogenase family)
MRAESHRALFDLSDRVAVVTGGAGILGPHLAAGLADFGAEVAVVDIAAEPAREVAARIAQRTGQRTLPVACDIADPASVRAMAERVEAELGPVEILLNNAAGKGGSLEAFFAPLPDFSLETWREISAVNLDGAFLVAQALGARMAERGRGSIVQTASIYGLMAPDQRIYEGSEYMGMAINTPAVYSATKAGVIGLTRYLATYWAERGVRVNCLVPGGIESGQNETFKTRYGARVPLGRMARAEEMVGAVVYLASDAASYVTGQVLAVDGGLSAW